MNNNEIFTEEEAKHHDFIPALANLAAEWFAKDSSILDFGCGDGSYVLWMRGRGFIPLGVEGTPSTSHRARGIVQWDLRYPFWMGRKAENVMCVEVMEHIYHGFHDTVMATLSRHCLDKLLLTWATPGQGGLRHISERDEAQVVPYVEGFGFHYLKEQSLRWREIVGAERSYMKGSIYCFQR